MTPRPRGNRPVAQKNPPVPSGKTIPRAAFGIILTCFFLSGFASLIYEMVWTRMMVLIFGATTLAVASVLTIFMGGLALGSLVFGRAVSRWAQPLLVYAVLEIAIGIYGLLIPWILPRLVPLYRAAWEAFGGDFYLFSLARFLLVGAVLLLPTTLMGATLPVLSQLFSAQSERAGRALGILYGINTLGAVAGTFCTGYFLLPMLGVQRSTLVAVLANLLVGVLSLIAWKASSGAWKVPSVVWKASSGRASPRAPMRTAPSPSPLAPPARISTEPVRVWLVLLAFALSGFCALVYEVAWSRALSLVLGSTLYAFSAMLTTFLVGLSVGSLISAYMVQRLRFPLRAMGVLQVLIALFAFLTLPLMGKLPYLFVSLYNQWRFSPTWIPLVWFGVSFAMMLLPTLFMGGLFPLVVRLLQGRLPTLGRLAGDVYAVNTVGAIMGSFCTGFILIPAIGIQSSVMAAVYMNLALGLILLLACPLPASDRGGGRSPRDWVLSSGAVALGVLLTFIRPAWDVRLMTSGVFLHSSSHADLLEVQGPEAFYKALEKDREIIFYKEGITATVVVESSPSGSRSLRINGRREAGDPFLRTQVLLGHLPLLLRSEPDADQVLVIGWGSGATVGSVAQHPVRRIVGVELEAAIIESSRFFEASNQRPLADPRVEAVINDGRNYLLLTPDRFDAIISQPSLPWITGASSLFTEEFFRLGASRLAEGGIFCQWVSGDAIALEDLRAVAKAFYVAFPHTWILNSVHGDLILVGSNEPLTLDPERLESALGQEAIAEDLRRVGIRTVEDLLTLYLFGGAEFERFVHSAVANTDDNAVVEVLGPVRYYTRTAKANLSQIKQALVRHQKAELAQGGHPLLQDTTTDPAEVTLRMARAYKENHDGQLALLFVNASLRYRETPEAYYLKGVLLSGLTDYLEQFRTDEASSREEVIREAVQAYATALQGGLAGPEILLARLDLGSILTKQGDLDRAAVQYEAILAVDPLFPEAYSGLGAIYLKKGLYEEALQAYRQALLADPHRSGVYFKIIGLILSEMGRYDEATEAFENVLEIAPDDPESHLNLARAYEMGHRPDEAVPHYQRFLSLVSGAQKYTAQRITVRLKLQEIGGGEGGRP